MGRRLCCGKGLQVTSRNRFPPGTYTPCAPACLVETGRGCDWIRISGCKHTAVPFCLGGLGFALDCSHSGSWEAGGERQGGARRTLLFLCPLSVGAVTLCFFSKWHSTGRAFLLLLIDMLKHQLKQLAGGKEGRQSLFQKSGRDQGQVTHK